MRVEMQSCRRPIVACLAVALLTGCLGCQSRRTVDDTKGLLISATLPLSSYAASSPRQSTTKGARLYFPQLEIYDESGNLVYSSHESVENARVLKELPSNIQSFRPQPEAVQLAESLESISAFRGRKGEILGHRRICVLATFLEECHACAVQEDALSDVQGQLLDKGINLLIVRLSRQ